MSEKKYPILVDLKIFELQGCGGISRIWSILLRNPLFMETTALQGSANAIGKSIFIQKNKYDISINSRKWIDRLTNGNFIFLKRDTVTFFTYYQFGFGLGKSIVVLHDLIPFAQKKTFLNIRKIRIILSLTLATKIISVSKKTYEEIANMYPRLAKKVEVIENPIDDFFVTSPDFVSAQSDQVTALYVGNRVGAKNFQDACLLLDSDKTILLKIVGELPNNDEATQYDIYIKNGRMVFLGRLSDRLYKELLFQCTFVFLPSLDEGFGYPFIESGACGKPIVSRMSGDFLELKNKHIFDYEPNKESIVRSVELAKKFSPAQGSLIRDEIIEKFGSDVASSKYIDVAKDLLFTS